MKIYILLAVITMILLLNGCGAEDKEEGKAGDMQTEKAVEKPEVPVQKTQEEEVVTPEHVKETISEVKSVKKPPVQKTPEPKPVKKVRMTTCRRCNGQGKIFTVCPVCGGKGKIIDNCPYCRGKGYTGPASKSRKCNPCKGTGKQEKRCKSCRHQFGSKMGLFDKCPVCRGTGKVQAR